MGAALAIVLTFSFSVLIVRMATVALQITGLPKTVAKFQALSAFSGAGFTSTETEQVVNFPVRRKVISYLIVVGNLGLVAVFSTLVVGFLQTGGKVGNVINQLAWIVGGVALVWFILLSKTGERVTHGLVRRFLMRYTELGRITFEPLLQIGDSWSIAEHRIAHQFTEKKIPLSHIAAFAEPGRVLAVRCRDGKYTLEPDADHQLAEGESVVLFTTNEQQRQAFKFCAGDTKTRS